MTPTIYAMRGLPASGKTTRAREMVAKGAKRVSKDDLRAMLHNNVYTSDLEIVVLCVRDAIIRELVEDGFDVVVDDTNLNPKHIAALSVMAREIDVNFQVVDVYADLETCIQRDAARAKPVGEEVIRRMHEKYLSGTGN